MIKILFIILTLIRLLVTGIREGLVWTDYDWNIDYHAVRTVDVIISGFILAYILGFWLALGTLMFGYCLIYERALQYINYKQLFYEQNPWTIWGIDISIRNWHMTITGLIGMVLIIIGLI